MKKIKKKALVYFFVFIMLISKNIALASSNKIGYYESGVKKYFTVSVSILDSKHSYHTISGEYQSGPSGYGRVFYTYNGRVVGGKYGKKVYGQGSLSYWTAAFSVKVGNIFKARTFVEAKGIKGYVTDYYN